MGIRFALLDTIVVAQDDFSASGMQPPAQVSSADPATLSGNQAKGNDLFSAQTIPSRVAYGYPSSAMIYGFMRR